MDISYSQVAEIRNALREGKVGGRFKKVSIDDITNSLTHTYAIYHEDFDKVKRGVKKFMYYIDNRKPLPGEALANVRIQVEQDHSGIEVNDDPQQRQRGCYNSLMDVGPEQRRRRLSPIIEYLRVEADNNKCSLNQLLASILKQAKYVHERETDKVEDKLLGNSVSSEMEGDKVMHLKHN